MDLALTLRKMEGEGAWGQGGFPLADWCGEGQLGVCGPHSVEHMWRVVSL